MYILWYGERYSSGVRTRLTQTSINDEIERRVRHVGESSLKTSVWTIGCGSGPRLGVVSCLGVLLRAGWYTVSSELPRIARGFLVSLERYILLRSKADGTATKSNHSHVDTPWKRSLSRCYAIPSAFERNVHREPRRDALKGVSLSLVHHVVLGSKDDGTSTTTTSRPGDILCGLHLSHWPSTFMVLVPSPSEPNER